MKRAHSIIPAVILLLAAACGKQEEQNTPVPERELSIPEKVEGEIMDVLSRDWKSLSDTLNYFDSTMLSKGRYKGKAPDGIYYELDIRIIPELEATFKVEDSTWVAVSGRISPLELKMTACETEMAIKKERNDSTGLSVSDIYAIVPGDFLTADRRQASLLYKDRRVGYLTREEFENTDYSTGMYLVVHYYNDPRTFAFYDSGLGSLLKKSLDNVTK